ncbi:MAG: Slp family lipoprotein [Nitrospirota bacterium]
MRRLLPLSLLFAVLLSCAPVLRQDLLDRAAINPPLQDMQANPSAYKGRLFVLGGMIVQTKFVPRGAQIEAVYIPVDEDGDLKSTRYAGGRYLALYPRDIGFLEPEIYKKDRRITIAGEFIGIQTGKLDEVEYPYPVFEIRDIHLWEEERPYYYPPYYGPHWRYPYSYPYRYPFWWDDPFWMSRPYPYWW